MKNINQVLKEELEMFDKFWLLQFPRSHPAEYGVVKKFLTQSHQNLISAFKEMVEEMENELNDGLGTNKQLDDAFPVVKKVLNNLLSSLTEETKI